MLSIFTLVLVLAFMRIALKLYFDIELQGYAHNYIDGLYTLDIDDSLYNQVALLMTILFPCSIIGWLG